MGDQALKIQSFAEGRGLIGEKLLKKASYIQLYKPFTYHILVDILNTFCMIDSGAIHLKEEGNQISEMHVQAHMHTHTHLSGMREPSGCTAYSLRNKYLPILKSVRIQTEIRYILGCM